MLTWNIGLGLCLLIGINTAGLVRAQSRQLPQPELITARQGLPQAFVPAIVQDRQGFIWMATRDGLCRYDGHDFTVFQPAPGGPPSLTSSGIAGVTLTSQGRLWISSEQGDLDLFDPFLETFVNLSRRPFYKRQFGSDLIDNYYPDRQNRLWLIFRRQGLVCIDLRTNRVLRFGVHPYQRLSVGGPDGGAIQQDRWGTVWVATEKGLTQFDPHTGQLRAYALPDQDIRELYSQPDGLLLIRTISSLLVVHPRRGLLGRYPLPRQNQGWVSHFTTDSRGSTYFNLDSLVLRFNQRQGIQPVAQVPYARYIRCLFIDRSDVLWMGTNGEGVRKYNLKAVAFEARPYQLNFHSDLLRTYFGVPSSSLPHFPVGSSAYNFRYTFDQQGKLWFNAGSTPFYQLDLSTKKLISIPFPARLALDNLDKSASLATDPDGQVWAIYDSLVVYYEKGQWKRFNFPIQGSVGLPALQLVVDREALWLATLANGLYRVDRRRGQVRHYVPQPGNTSSLSSRELIGLFADPMDTNLLWIGTFGSGLCRFDKRTGQCRRLTTREGLPNNVVYSAIPDRQGFIWVATNQGLCQVDRRTFRTRTYTQEDGLQADEFNRFHAMHLPDDRIILGGIAGMTAFDPSLIQDDTYQPITQLTAIQVNNQSLPPVRDSLPIQAIQELDLPHDRNFVTVHFASLQYNRQTKIRYRYRLEGLDQDWIQTDRPVAGYTALGPGRFILQLNAANTSGQWSPHIRTLTIVIRPPWWATGWAYGAYGLLLVALIYAYIQFRIEKLRQEQAIRTRISSDLHDELGGLLTGISLQADYLVYSASTDQHRQTYLTQIADASKKATSAMSDLVWSIDSRNDDWDSLLARMREYAYTLFEAAGIQVTFTTEGSFSDQGLHPEVRQNVYLFFKEVVHNVCKHAHASQVTIDLSFEEQWFQMTIADNGIGLSGQAHSSGQGMKNLQVRADRLQGKLAVQNRDPGLAIQLVIDPKKLPVGVRKSWL